MPPKSKGKASAAARAADASDARAQVLSRLQESETDWWDGVEVNVPWAAASSAYAKRADCWLGIISDVVEKDNALDSEYTIEDPGDPDDAVVVSGAQLAGLEGFGNHDARIECAEIDDEVADPTPILVDSSGAPAAAPKPRGRPKGSKNKPKDGSARAAARAEADADGIDPLGAFCDELDGEGATPKSTGAKLRQGWEYTEYTEELDNPRLQPERVWGGITHPRLRRRSYDARFVEPLRDLCR